MIRLALVLTRFSRIALLGGVVGASLLVQAGSAKPTPVNTSPFADLARESGEPTEAAAVQGQPAAAPRYYYGPGYQGYGYYAAPAPRPAPAPAPATQAVARSSVGPGARNWSTGRRSPLHRPWMRPM